MSHLVVCWWSFKSLAIGAEPLMPPAVQHHFHGVWGCDHMGPSSTIHAQICAYESEGNKIPSRFVVFLLLLHHPYKTLQSQKHFSHCKPHRSLRGSELAHKKTAGFFFPFLFHLLSDHSREGRVEYK